MNKRTKRNVVIAMICSMFTIVMCRCYDNSVGFVTYQNGLTCQFFTDYSLASGLLSSEGHQCTYVCPNGFLVTMDLPIEKLSISQSNLESEICRDAGPPATNTAITSTSTATLSSVQVTTTAVSPTVSPTPTLLLLPLLTNEVTSCGAAGATRIIWINFRLAEPRLDLTGRELSVTIGGQPASCGINRDNTSILSCFLPPTITYPASVVVHVDGVEVNNFTINVNNGVCRPRATSTSEPAAQPPTAIGPSAIPPTPFPPTTIPPTAVPPTTVPPTAIPPTTVPPTPKP